MKLIKTAVVVTIIIVIVSIYGSYVANTTDTTQTQTVKKTEPRKVNTELQKKRMAFIEKLFAQGLCDKFEIENEVGKVWVTNKFLLLSEKDMNSLLEVPYAYTMEHLGTGIFTTSLILKVDNGTQLGKRIGRYSPTDGVEFYK